MKMLAYNPIDIFYYLKKQSFPYASSEEIASYIGEKIIRKEPCMVGRLGAVECANLRINEFHYIHKRQLIFNQLCDCAGFFPNDVSMLKEFCDTYKSAIKNLDIAVPWCNFVGQEYFFKHYCKKNVKYSTEPIEFYKREHSWIDYMEGRTLLVIHPFALSIEKQFPNMDKIYPQKRIFPKNMNLKTLKAVQTAAGCKDDRFQNWFEALEWMAEEVEKIEFDVAILGCGAYGMPLASRIKEMGKISIVIGADIQKIFGIFGYRWRRNKDVNEYWIRPSKEETPEKFQIVEGGCYW